MRVLFCSRDATYSETPDWARVTLNLAKALAEIGCEVWSVTPHCKFSLKPWEKHVHFIGSLNDLEKQNIKFDIVQGVGLSSGKIVVELANKFNAKPLQWFSNDILLNLSDFSYMLAHERPIISRSKERFMLCLQGLIPAKLKRFMIKKFHVSNLVVPTWHVANQFIRCGVEPNKMFVIPLGVDSQLFLPISFGEHFLVENEVKNFIRNSVFFFGGTTPFRGIQMVVEAFKIANRKVKDAKLVLAIWGSRLQCKNCLNIGYKKDLYHYVGLFDVICLPFKSTYGMTSIPLTLLEAMSVGKPVVSTNIKPISEVIIPNKDGILVDYDKQSIARAIVELLEDEPLRERLGNNARKKIEQKYDWRVVAKKFAELYAGL